jgi:hypothetical protein
MGLDLHGFKIQSWSKISRKKVDKKKTRKITQEHFPKLPQVEQLIKIFKNENNDVRVTKVWFL